MTDPVQVVAEARCLRGEDYPFNCNDARAEKHPECAVAALREAGALMPDEAEGVRSNVAANAEHASTYIVRLTRSEALLQEVREVLELLVAEPCFDCGWVGRDRDHRTDCWVTQLLQKIEQSALRPAPTEGRGGTWT